MNSSYGDKTHCGLNYVLKKYITKQKMAIVEPDILLDLCVLLFHYDTYLNVSNNNRSKKVA